VLAAGAAPRPRSWRLKLRRPGLSGPDWTVTASVFLRWGRGPGRSRRPAAEDNKKDRPRMHAIVSVPSTGPSRPAEDLAGQPTEPELERTKPQSAAIQSSRENMSVPGDREAAFAAGYAVPDRLIRLFTGRRVQRSRNMIKGKRLEICRPPGACPSELGIALAD